MRYEHGRGEGGTERRVSYTVVRRLMRVAFGLLYVAGIVVILALVQPRERTGLYRWNSPLALWLVSVPVAAYLLSRFATRCVDGYATLRRRLAIRRARAAFRSALEAARRHPELVDLKRLYAAALHVRQLCDGQPDPLSVPEIEEAIDHPYRPIRDAARLVVEAPDGSKSSPTRSGS